jgi:hypothetical protein
MVLIGLSHFKLFWMVMPKYFLFLIFINDLEEYIQHSTLRLFADDSIICKQIKNKEDAIKLQQEGHQMLQVFC